MGGPPACGILASGAWLSYMNCRENAAPTKNDENSFQTDALSELLPWSFHIVRAILQHLDPLGELLLAIGLLPGPMVFSERKLAFVSFGPGTQSGNLE